MQNLNSQSWSQLRFGKPVIEKDGPIVKGSEHQTTGASSTIDKTLQTHLTPATVGLGTNDRTNWREYTWFDEGGGMVTQIHEHNGDLLLLAGKVCGRTESGKKLGRIYTEAHYAVLPITEHQFPTTMGLFQALHTTPQLQGSNPILPPLEVKSIDLPLPNNWLALVTPVVKILLSGLPLSIKTTKRSLQEMATFIHIVQSCLPNTLAWRLTTKIGAMECSAEEAVCSVVQASNFEMPRMIGFSMEDAEKNTKKLKDIDQAIPHPLLDNELIGLRYIEYLHDKCAQCTTTTELQHQIHTDFPKLQQWDYFDASLSLPKVGVDFIQVLFEDDGIAQLKTALADGGEFPSLKVFFHRKVEALTLLLQHVWEHPRVVLESLNQWADVWNEIIDKCPTELQTVVLLLHPTSPVSESTFPLLTTDIPQDFHPFILQKLGAWIAELRAGNRPHPLWLNFLSQYAHYAPWIQKWIGSQDIDLALITRYVYNDKHIHAGLPFSQWLHDLSEPLIVNALKTKDISFAKLVGEQPPHIQVAVVEEFYSYAPLLIIQEVLKTPKLTSQAPITAKHILSDIVHWESRLQKWLDRAPLLFEHFDRLHHAEEYVSVLFRQVLMHLFSTLSAEKQSILWPILSKHIGDQVAQWRFERSSNQTTGSMDAFYIQQFPTLYQQGHQPLQTLFVEVATQTTMPHHQALVEVGKQILQQEKHTHPLPKALRAIQTRQLQSVVGLEPSWLQFWLKELDLTIHLDDIYTKETLCDFFFALSPRQQEPPLALLNRLFKERSQDSTVWHSWKERIQSLQWQNGVGWRLLFMEYTPNRPLESLTHKLEVQFFQQSNIEIQAHFVYCGFLVEPSNFADMTKEEFLSLSTEAQDILVWLGLHFNHPDLALLVVRAHILSLPEHQRQALKSDVSSAFAMFSALAQKVSDYFEDTPTQLPEALTPTEWVREYLLGLPKEERLSLFVD